MDLLESIRNKTSLVGVIGLGYVGLPLVREFSRAGFRVIGFDVDADKVRMLQAGESYIKHIPSSMIAQLNADGRFEATGDFDRLAEPDAILICVPTPLTKTHEPDLRFVEATGREIASRLRVGQLVILESTTYPGTTEEVLQPILEASGLRCSTDFYLGYSPEREDPGNPKYTAGTIPKVVAGVDPVSRDLAVALYEQVVVRVVPVSGPAVAEACKILENTYRAVNIAMVNELKMLFDRMGVDVWEVIDAAATKPFGFHAFYPGPGLGGHCIPIDPFYLSWLAKRYDVPTRFIELAGQINTAMPYYVVGKVTEALNDRGKAVRGSRILVLGAAYKKDVDDARESPSFMLIEQLMARGATVAYNDPHIPKLGPVRQHDIHLESVPLTAESLGGQDCVLIATDHTAYDYDWIVAQSDLVVDTRNATARVVEHRDRIVRA